MTLSVDDVVDVQVDLAPTAAGTRSFGVGLILGDSDVIDVTERLRGPYEGSADVSADFGANAPEAIAATRYFEQSPQPQDLYIGRWAAVATAGSVRGGVLNAAAQALANFTVIVNGGMNITVNGVAKNLANLNFSAQTNLNGVANVVTTALAGAATMTWDANNGRFMVKSSTTGIASTVTFASTGAGTDVSALFGLTQATGAYLVPGQLAETYASAVSTMIQKTNKWYGLYRASAQTPTTQDIQDASNIIEGSRVSHIQAVTSQDASSLNSTTSTDIGSILKGLGLKRTCVQFSSFDPYAAISMLARAFTVNFDGSDTTITLKFKQEPGVTPEDLTESQAAALKGKNINVFAEYDNDTAILQEGVMCNGFFFDEVHGADWLQNALQTACFNVLYTNPKVPQTEPGVTELLGACEQVCDQADNNDFFAPGVWTGPNIGPVKTGMTLSKGYIVFAAPLSTQSAADRAARKAPLIQIAAKLAGAIHSSSVLVSINR